MKTPLLALCAIAIPSFSFAGDFSGDWKGTGFQDGDTWDMEVQIVENGARVDYPDIPCGGIWIFGSSQARGHEWLTYGHDLCIDGLIVRIGSRGSDAILVEWLDDTGVVIANAPLSRVGGGAESGQKDKAQK